MNWKKFNGFSLMEMMVVLLIVAIVLAASAPMISRKMVGGAGDTGCEWKRLLNGTGIAYNHNDRTNNDRQTVFIGTQNKAWKDTNIEQPKLIIGSNSLRSPHITLVGTGAGQWDSTNTTKINITTSPSDNGFAIRQAIDVNESNTYKIGKRSLAIGMGSAATGTDGSVALGLNAVSRGKHAIAIGSTEESDDIPGNVDSIDVDDIEGAENEALPPTPLSTYIYENYTLAGLIKNAKDKFSAMLSGVSNIPGSAAFATNSSQYWGTGSTSYQISPLDTSDHTKALGTGSIAIGIAANSNKEHAIAIGTNARAGSSSGTNTNASNTIAIGTSAVANHPLCSALGFQAKATSNNTTAIGAHARATGKDSTALGFLTFATGDSSVAMGTFAHAAELRTIAFGAGNSNHYSLADAVDAIAIGTDSRARGSESIAIGRAAKAGKNGSGEGANTDCVAIGKSANATGDMTVAIGYNATATTMESTVLGHDASANGAESVAIGRSAIAGNGTNTDCVAIGKNATATGDMSTAVGYQARAEARSATTYGHASNASGIGAVALGRHATASALGSIAIGGAAPREGHAGNYAQDTEITQATGQGAIAIGRGANAQGQESLAIGYNTAANNGSIVLGYNTSVASTFGIAIGAKAEVTKDGGIAIGGHTAPSYKTSSTGLHAVAIGQNSTAEGGDSVAIGYGARATKDNYIELGTSSHTVHIPGNLIVDGKITGKGNLTIEGIARVGHLIDTGNVIPGGGSGSGSGIGTGDSRIPIGRSDRRLKNVGEVYKAGLNELKKLDFYHYTFKDDKTKTPRVGVMAQDLQKIFPDAVVKGEDGFLRIRLEDMFYAVINAVKELDAKVTAISEQVKSTVDLTAKLQAKIDSQQKEIAILKKKNAEFEKRLKNLENKMK